MSYIEKVVVDGERLLATGRTHWFIYVKPLAGIVLGLIITLINYRLLIGEALLFASLFWLLMIWIYVISTELAVTDKRIIAKFGFIAVHTVEVRHDKIESLTVNQSIFGRIFGFGSLFINGSGGTSAPIPYIANPLQFRSAALTGIDLRSMP